VPGLQRYGGGRLTHCQRRKRNPKWRLLSLAVSVGGQWNGPVGCQHIGRGDDHHEWQAAQVEEPPNAVNSRGLVANSRVEPVMHAREPAVEDTVLS
jgi:hypothetical protein